MLSWIKQTIKRIHFTSVITCIRLITVREANSKINQVSLAGKDHPLKIEQTLIIQIGLQPVVIMVSQIKITMIVGESMVSMATILREAGSQWYHRAAEEVSLLKVSHPSHQQVTNRSVTTLSITITIIIMPRMQIKATMTIISSLGVTWILILTAKITWLYY